MRINDIEGITPIKIDIADRNAFFRAALLSDSPHFLQEINNIRDSFEIRKIFKYGDYSAWNDHLYKLSGFEEAEIAEIHKINKTDTPNSDLKIFMDTREIQRDRLKELKDKFQEELTRIRELLRYPLEFDEIIKEAILFNAIKTYPQSAYVISFAREDSFGVNKFPQMNAIVFQPYATKEDVISAFDSWKNQTKVIKYEAELYSDSVSNVERDREWFWLKYGKRKSYSEILENWNNKCPEKKIHQADESCVYCDLVDQNIIEQSVLRYKKKIQLLFASKS